VLRPKVHGSLVLAEVLATEPALDFYVAFSSRASVGGLVGGGDYAAANAFLDAHTRLLARAGVPARTMNWPSWSEVGMAVAAEPAPPADAHVWETVVDPAADPIVDEHRAAGVAVMPGTGHLDMAWRAFRAAVGPADALVRLSDVVFRQGLFVTEPRRVRVTFRPDGDGWRWEISSTAMNGDDRHRHVTGRVEVCADEPPAAEGLAALRTRLSTVDDRKPPHGLFSFGPRWDTITRLTLADAAREYLLDLRLPDAFLADLDRHPLHPAVLDTATSAARDIGLTGTHVPFQYGSLTAYAELPARCHSHVVWRDDKPGLAVADITVYAPDGRIVLVVKEFVMVRTSREDFAPPAPKAPVLPPGHGIDPAEGARLFLGLLAAGGPPQVAVRPFRDGGYVPLTSTTPVPAPRPAPAAVEPKPAAAPAPAPAGTGSVRDRLAALWSEVLGVRAIRGEDDFFELGGNSLVAVELISRVRDSFGVSTSIVAVFDNPRLDALAAVLAEQGAS
jgi:acyl transferase domain-containing protein